MLVLKVVEVRLRFIVILIATGLFIGYWDTVKNHWEKWTRPEAAVVRELPSDKEFYCPMHPNVVRSSLDPSGAVPRCPICGMPLSQRRRGEVAALPAGVTSRVQLSPDRIRLAGITTEEVTLRPLAREVTTVGFVQYDEARLSRIVSRVSGYLEKLYVNQTFAPVDEGAPLAEIYSPELYSSVRELLLAAKDGRSPELVASARERLKLLGVGDREVDECFSSGHASPRLVIRAPRSGQVIRKEVVEGAYVDVGATLFEVAELSTVWVEAAVYEKDIRFLRQGAAVEASVEAFSDRVFRGKIALVYPKLEASTRTITVRFVLENPGFALRPGMFATVRIQTPLNEIEPFQALARDGAVLAVPELAVIDTGSRKIVYVERTPGLFEGLQVELGPRIGAFYPVVKGLQAGDRVAGAGSFLVDAETRLNPAAASTYVGAGGGPTAQRPGPARPMSEASPPGPASAPAPVAGLEGLAPEDRARVLAQRACPISGETLGAMGEPFKLVLDGEALFLCCPSCEKDVRRDPAAALRKVAASLSDTPARMERP